MKNGRVHLLWQFSHDKFYQAVILLVSKLQVYTPSSIVCSHIHYCSGALVSFLPQDGWSALMLASDSGNTDIVQLLLSSGAKLDLQNKVRHSIVL